MPLEFVHSGIGESPSEAPFTGLARRSRVLGRSFYGRYTALVLFPSARLSGLSHLGFPFVALASVGPMQQDSAEGCVRLERGEDPAETVVVRNEAFLTALRQSAPAEVGRFVRGQTQTRWDLTLLAIVEVVALGSLLYFWGVPAAGRVRDQGLGPDARATNSNGDTTRSSRGTAGLSRYATFRRLGQWLGAFGRGNRVPVSIRQG